jgi:isovaleryl-CoA dehydrogenase
MARYATERKAFGQPIAEFGQIQRHIGESYARLRAIESLVYTVAHEVAPGKRNRLGTDAAKLFASTAAKEIADSAIQVLGGYGYCSEYRVEQFFRDAKLIEIGGGTIEAHQKNITRDLLDALP